MTLPSSWCLRGIDADEALEHPVRAHCHGGVVSGGASINCLLSRPPCLARYCEPGNLPPQFPSAGPFMMVGPQEHRNITTPKG